MMQEPRDNGAYVDRMEWEKQLLNPELDHADVEEWDLLNESFASKLDRAEAGDRFKRSRRAVIFDLIDEAGWGVAGYPIDD